MKRKKLTISSGSLKGRKLEVLDQPGLRPTSSKTKETVFNWLQNSLRDKSCLDLFAGTGALGFECISRGANRCVLVEKNRVVYEQIKKKDLFICSKADVIKNEAINFLMNNDELFDIVFLDPPFETNLLKKVLKIMENRTLKENAVIYLESSQGVSLPVEWEVLKKSKSRNTEFMLVRKKKVQHAFES